MKAKQLTIFIENREGRLEEVLSILTKNNINIKSLSLADTEDFGLLRMIVSNPDLGKEKLTEAGFSTTISEVVIVEIDNKCGSLAQLLKLLKENNINIEYMYGLNISKDKGSIVLKATPVDMILNVLKKNNFKLYSDEDVAGIDKK